MKNNIRFGFVFQAILGGLFAGLFLCLLGSGTAGRGRRRRFLAVSLSWLAIGFYTLLVGAGGDQGRARPVRRPGGLAPTYRH